jgi:spermidine/putrescine transport system permease protein
VTQGSAPSTGSGRPPIDRAGRWVDRVFRSHAALIYLFLYVPIGLVVMFSFNAGERTGELRGLSTRWYAYAVADRFAMAALRNSLVVATWTAILATSFGTIAALALQRTPRRVRAVFDAITYVAIIIPGIVIGIATLIFFVNLFGWLNPWLDYVWTSAGLGASPPTIGTGLHTVVAAHVLFTMAIVMVLVRARLAGMDRALTEASFDLFAPPLRTFIQVTLPQLWPAIITGALLAFTFSFDDYVIASFVAGPGQPTLPMYVFASIRRGITPEINAIASMILGLTVTALVIAGLVYRRQARQGRTSDALELETLAVAVPIGEEPA